MAQYQLAAIIILDPVDVAFAANDVLRIYWDDVTEEIVVTLNGASFTTEGTLLGQPPSQTEAGNYQVMEGVTSIENGDFISAYSFCETTTLVWFSMVSAFPQYPFFGRQTTPDSPVCDVGGGAVCDIHWVGDAQITHATNQTEGGSVLVTAESSNGVVRYGLRSSDNYSDYSNTSGSITSLPPGEWTIYAIDPNNCRIQKKVKILYKPVGIEHYRATWMGLQTGSGSPWRERLRIYEREYVGTLVELTHAGPQPFHKNKPKQGELNDKLFPVHPTNGTLVLTGLYDNQFIQLATQDNKKFLVVHEIDTNLDGTYEPIWQGFITPSVWAAAFLPGIPNLIEIPISDNVKTLEKEPFTDSAGNPLTGDMKLIKIISLIMQKTGLTLKIRSGINIFEANHTIESDGSSDPLDQTYVDVTCYRKDGEPFMCWDVLVAILRPFGARIYQEDNQWIIEEIDRSVAAYDYRVFTTDGVYESNSTFDPLMDIKNPSESNRAALIARDHSQEIIPAYGKIDVISQFNYIGSIVSGGFEKTDLLSPNSEEFNPSQGIYTSEEGFRDWTLRLNGTTGVSFGRVVVGENQAQVSRRGIQGADANRSVGAFFYDDEAWSGNLRNAYVESAVKNYQYGPGDLLKLEFEYSTPAKPEYEFMVLRFVLKVGTNYLQPNLEWGATEAIFRAYPSISNSLQKFELTVPVPDTTVIVDSNIQLRIYFYASAFYDHGIPTKTADVEDGTDGLASLDTVVTDGIDYDYRVDLRREITTIITNYVERGFWELAPNENDAADSPANGIIHVGDYDNPTNKRIWRRIKGMNATNDETNTRRRGVDVKFYIDNVALDALINGQPPPLEETISLEISKYVNETLEVPLYNFDCPDITNAKNMYNNHFKLSNGEPTSAWTRTGISESLKLQQILLKVLGGNHSAPTTRLTGSFINEFARIGFNKYLRITEVGADLTMSNTLFDTDINSWTGDNTGEAFAWSSENSGSAAVTLLGAEDSEKLYQDVVHEGGQIQVSVNIYIDPASDNDREDQLWLLFYKDGNIIQTEKLLTFVTPTSADQFQFSYKTFLAADVDRIGFYIRRVTGTGECTYYIAEFTPEGADVEKIFQISDLQYDVRRKSGFFELMQISKAYTTLAGIDQGGTGQTGSETGNSFNGDFNNDFGSDFDTTLN